MKQIVFFVCLATAFTCSAIMAQTQGKNSQDISFGPYEYESKPDHDAFRSFNPRKAPLPGKLLLNKGDRLAICGDSITEQKMYSRLVETYLTACLPQWEVTVRQYGWSGEKTDGFLRRMEQDCLTFKPTIATLAYGMNDSRYRPFDTNNGQWYRDHYTAIVRRFKENDVRVVVGSPGCAGKIASWVKSRAGTLEQHNIHLCALRDIAMGVAEREQVRFADIFWPMYQAQVFAPEQHSATPERPYFVAGKDGIHPGWAGQVIMAWAFLRALGVSGEIGTVTVDAINWKAAASEGHQVKSIADGRLTLTSSRYPFCSRGAIDHDNSIRSGMTLVPFNDDLNRLVLKIQTPDSQDCRVTWGSESRTYSSEQLKAGINLANDFPDNPFCDAFERVSEAVGKKQAYETQQVKRHFHSRDAETDFDAVVKQTEAIRKPLADAISDTMQPLTHTITLELIDNN